MDKVAVFGTADPRSSRGEGTIKNQESPAKGGKNPKLRTCWKYWLEHILGKENFLIIKVEFVNNYKKI